MLEEVCFLGTCFICGLWKIFFGKVVSCLITLPRNIFLHFLSVNHNPYAKNVPKKTYFLFRLTNRIEFISLANTFANLLAILNANIQEQNTHWIVNKRNSTHVQSSGHACNLLCYFCRFHSRSFMSIHAKRTSKVNHGIKIESVNDKNIKTKDRVFSCVCACPLIALLK